jgi:hypothetical protein
VSSCWRSPVADGEDVVHLVQWAWGSYGRGTVIDAADARLNGEFDGREMETVMVVGLWCAHPDRSFGPSMCCGQRHRCRASPHGCRWQPSCHHLKLSTYYTSSVTGASSSTGTGTAQSTTTDIHAAEMTKRSAALLHQASVASD